MNLYKKKISIFPLQCEAHIKKEKFSSYSPLLEREYNSIIHKSILKSAKKISKMRSNHSIYGKNVKILTPKNIDWMQPANHGKTFIEL